MFNTIVDISTGEVRQTPLSSTEIALIEEAKATFAANKKDLDNARMKDCRAAAYKEESDALFFKAQRGEVTMQEWQNKVAEIRDRFPYQE